jgi:DNA excision repair protein ERCC-2
MPTGTGKTVSLLALIIAYLAQKPNQIKKLIYCTRTVVEMEKTLQEVKLVLKARKAEGIIDKFTAVGLSSRKNLCINPDVIGQKERVDSECRKRTAEWVRKGEFETCLFYENF